MCVRNRPNISIGLKLRKHKFCLRAFICVKNMIFFFFLLKPQCYCHKYVRRWSARNTLVLNCLLYIFLQILMWRGWTHLKRYTALNTHFWFCFSYCPLVSGSTYQCLSAANVGDISDAFQRLSGHIISKIIFKTKIGVVMILEYIYIYWKHDYFILFIKSINKWSK